MIYIQYTFIIQPIDIKQFKRLFHETKEGLELNYTIHGQRKTKDGVISYVNPIFFLFIIILSKGD